MRWFVLLLCLWCCPVSFANDNTEEDQAASVSAVERRGGCPGGICRPGKRPRPTR